MRFLPLLVLVTACHPVLSIGYDTKSVKKGPLAQIAGEPVSRQGAAAAATTTTAAAGEPVVDAADSYTLGIGAGSRNLTVGATVIASGVEKSSFAVAADGTQRYMSGAAALDLKWSWLRWHGLSTSIHAGPAATVLVDRTTGERSWAQGLRFGAGAEVAVKGLGVFADFHRDVVVFGDGAASGTSSISGITIGVAFHP